jgi:hypothetical protein
MALKAACDREGLNIPYPIRTMYLFDQQQFDDATPVSRDRSANGQANKESATSFN